MKIQQFRYADDDPGLYGFVPVSRGANNALHGRALSQHVRVSEKVLPEVFGAVGRVRDRLGIPSSVTAFVYPSPETNAYCHGPSASEPVLIFVSSALVTLVSTSELEFVIGHELGHFVFEHFSYPDEQESAGNMRLLELRRASELSADRAGLAACRHLETALTATLKVASGLTEAHLNIDILDYVRQVRELSQFQGDESLLYSTHPSFPLRARALLRFDSVLQRALDGEYVQDVLLETDEQIRRELDRAAAGANGNSFTDAAMSAAFWSAAHTLCSDGRLDESEQERLASRFGTEKVDALKRVLASRPRNEALEFLGEKRRVAEESLSGAPLFVIRAAKQAMRGFAP